MDWLSLGIFITTALVVSVSCFSCEKKPVGQYCTKDLTGFYDCRIISKTTFKKYVIRMCGDGRKCSCDPTIGCKKKICVRIMDTPLNKRLRMSLSFIGSNFIWDNGEFFKQELSGEVYEDAEKKLFLKKQTRKGVRWETDKFELVVPDSEDRGTFVKYFGKRKIYPPELTRSNKTRSHRECHKSKVKQFPRLLDLTRFTLINSKNITTNQTLQTWAFRSKRIHRTTDQVRTTWKVVYDAEKKYLFPRKYRDVKKNMPGPRLKPYQKGEIRNLVFKELNLNMTKETFKLPAYCKELVTLSTVEGYVE